MARELRAVMQGRVVLPGDDDYAQTRQIWNGAVQHQPALIAVCETSDDVQAAVRSAREHASPRSVRGGGHDWAGRALRHTGENDDTQKLNAPHTNLSGAKESLAKEASTGKQAGAVKTPVSATLDSRAVADRMDVHSSSRK